MRRRLRRQQMMSRWNWLRPRMTPPPAAASDLQAQAQKVVLVLTA
jgi:hypothetical protein